MRSLLVQINDAADRAEGGLQGHQRGRRLERAVRGAGSTELAPPPGTVSVGSAGFSAMPFTFGFEGSFFRLSNFFNRLEDFVTVTNKDVDVTGRLLLLGSISLAPTAGISSI